MAELGRIGIGCARPTAIDDVHVTTDKVAVFQHARSVGAGEASVPALVYTSLLPSSPLIMLNLESGDYGSLEERDCGCPLGELGFTTHLSELRAYDKMTSEGVTFLGNELYEIVEVVLPGGFGGNPTDYQLAEEESETGLPRVSIVVSPRVGPVDEEAAVAAVMRALAASSRAGADMAEAWRQAGTLRVVRREPHAAADRKILPLVKRPGAGE
jgi:hypothetical protein